MSKLVHKIKIDTYEINQPFLHQEEEFISTDPIYTSYKIRLDTWQPIDNGYYFIEYILVVIEKELDIEKMYAVLQANGQDLWDRQNYIFHNKVFPLECENLYDSETNNLLQNMVRNKDNVNLKKVLFLPFRSAKNGHLLDTSPNIHGDSQIPSNRIDNLQLNLYAVPMGKIDIFMRVTDKNSQNIDKLNYSHV